MQHPHRRWTLSAVCHRVKRRVRVWCTLPVHTLSNTQTYIVCGEPESPAAAPRASAFLFIDFPAVYRPPFIGCLSINTPPPGGCLLINTKPAHPFFLPRPSSSTVPSSTVPPWTPVADYRFSYISLSPSLYLGDTLDPTPRYQAFPNKAFSLLSLSTILLLLVLTLLLALALREGEEFL